MHDSFWTHPSDVDEMGTSLRKVNNNMCLMADFLFEALAHILSKKQFIQLHSLPLLEDFRNQILHQVSFPLPSKFLFYSLTQRSSSARNYPDVIPQPGHNQPAL